MVVQLLCRDVFLEINGTDGGFLDGNLFQLLGESRLGIHILRRDGLIARLFQCLFVRCAILLAQGNIVSAIVFLCCGDDIFLCDLLDVFNLIEHLLPRVAFREDINHQFRTTANGFQIAFIFHHHLLFQGFHLLCAEVSVHHLLHLFHDTCLSRLHLA